MTLGTGTGTRPTSANPLSLLPCRAVMEAVGVACTARGVSTLAGAPINGGPHGLVRASCVVQQQRRARGPRKDDHMPRERQQRNAAGLLAASDHAATARRRRQTRCLSPCAGAVPQLQSSSA